MRSPTVIAIVNEKGGTGKTTTAVNLSAALGELKQKVLLVDLDGQAASSRWLGVEEDDRLSEALCRGKGLAPIPDVLPGVSLAPGSGKLDSVAHDLRPTQGGQLRKVLSEMTGYDFILLDCPPSLGNRLIGNALLAASHAIVPVETSILALDGLKILLTTLEDVREGFGHELILGGVLACRYDPRTRLSRLVLAELQRALPGKVFQTVIRENVRMRECPASGQSILTFAGDSHAAEDYRALARELLESPAMWREPAPYMVRSQNGEPAGNSGFSVNNLRDNAAAAVREAARTASWRRSADQEETQPRQEPAGGQAGEENQRVEASGEALEAWLASLADAERRLEAEGKEDHKPAPAGEGVPDQVKPSAAAEPADVVERAQPVGQAPPVEPAPAPGPISAEAPPGPSAGQEPGREGQVLLTGAESSDADDPSMRESQETHAGTGETAAPPAPPPPPQEHAPQDQPADAVSPAASAPAEESQQRADEQTPVPAELEEQAENYPALRALLRQGVQDGTLPASPEDAADQNAKTKRPPAWRRLFRKQVNA